MSGVLASIGLSGINAVIERLASLIPDPEARARALRDAQTEMVNTLQASDAAQGAVNAEEAKHNSLFVAGWRPAAGWVSVFGLCYEFILHPILPWAAQTFGFGVAPLPSLSENLWQLLFGLLGLGALRSFEKARGVGGR